MDWGGVVVGGDDPLLAGLSLAGRGLVAAAADVLDEAGVPRMASLAEAVTAGRPVLVLDAHCPLVSAGDVARVRAAAAAGPAVGVRPVTDTVKRVRRTADGEWLGETVDRESLAAVAAPLAVPDPAVLAGLEGAGDVAELVAALRRRREVALVEVSPAARRVRDASDLALLSAG